MSGISIDNGGLVRVNDSDVGVGVSAGDGISVVTSTAYSVVSIDHAYSNEWSVQQVVKNNDVDESSITGWNLATNGIGVAGLVDSGETSRAIWGLTNSGRAIVGTALTTGIPFVSEIANADLGNSIVAQFRKELTVNTVPTLDTALSIDGYLPDVTGNKAIIQAHRWKTSYDSLSSGTESTKVSLWLKYGTGIINSFVFSKEMLWQTESTAHMFGNNYGFRLNASSLQYKDSNVTDWTNIYHTHNGGDIPSVVDTVVPSTPTNLRYSWRNEGDISFSWTNPSPTTNGNRLIHDYELEMAYDLDFLQLFYHQNLGRQTETIVGVKSLAPSFDLRLPDGYLEHAIELVYSGIVTGGSRSALQCAVDLEAEGVEVGMVCRYMDSEGHWSCGTISSVSTVTINIDGIWSNVYGNISLFPRAGQSFEICRTMFETQFRDYSDPTSLKYGYFGFNESPLSGYSSSTYISNGAIVAEGDLLGSGHTAVTLLRYPMQDPNYTIECEMEIKNPFNGGHLAIALRASAYDLNVDSSVYNPTYYACVVDFGWGGFLSKNGAWIEKNTYPRVSEVGMFNVIFPLSTSLAYGCSPTDTDIVVEDGSIFSKSLSITTTGYGFQATNFLVPSSLDVSDIIQGCVVTYGDYKASVDSVGDVTGSYRVINVFEWFNLYSNSAPEGSGSVTITYDRYAILQNKITSPYFVESVKIISIDGNAITVTRAQHGTTAQSFPGDTVVGPRFTPEYGRKYRIMADIYNAVEGTPPTIINLYVDGTLYATASDTCDGVEISSNLTTFNLDTPYSTISIGAADADHFEHISVGDVIYDINKNNCWVCHYTYEAGVTNTIYVSPWCDVFGNAIGTPSNSTTIYCSREKYTRAGQIGIGGLNWGIYSALGSRSDLYVYRIHSRYTSYRIGSVYCRVRAHNQIGQSGWCFPATIHAPDRMSPQLTALNIIPDHHVIAWSFDALSPEVNGYELKAYTEDVGGTWVYTRPVSSAERILVVPMDDVHDTLWWEIGTVDPFGKSEASPYRVVTTPSRGTGGDSLWYSKTVGDEEVTYLGTSATWSTEPVCINSMTPMTHEGVIAKFTSTGDSIHGIGIEGVSVGDYTTCGVLGASLSTGYGVLGVSYSGGYGGGFVTRLNNDATVVSAGGIKRESKSTDTGHPMAGTGVGFDFLLETDSLPTTLPVVANKIASVWDNGVTKSRYSIYSYDTATLFRTADFLVQSSSSTNFSSQLRLLSSGSGLYGYGFISSETTAGSMMPLLLASSGLYIGNSITATTGSLLGFTVAQGKIINIITPNTIAASYNLTLPTTAGTNGYVLTTNGSGVLSWGAAGGSGTHPYPHALASGTASAPAYSFSAQTTIGMWREAQDTLALTGRASGGSDGNQSIKIRGISHSAVLEINSTAHEAAANSIQSTCLSGYAPLILQSTQVMSGVDGQIAYPAYSFSSQPTIGMWREGLDILVLTGRASGGSDGNQSIKIYGTSHSAVLEINSTAHESIGNFIYSKTSSTFAPLYLTGSKIFIYTGSNATDYSLPTTRGTNGQALISNGAGGTSWGALGGTVDSSVLWTSNSGHTYRGTIAGHSDETVSIGTTYGTGTAGQTTQLYVIADPSTSAITGKTASSGVMDYGVGGWSTHLASYGVIGLNSSGGYGVGSVVDCTSAANIAGAGGVARQNAGGTGPGTVVSGTGVAFDFFIPRNSAIPILTSRIVSEWDTYPNTVKTSIFAYDPDAADIISTGGINPCETRLTRKMQISDGGSGLGFTLFSKNGTIGSIIYSKDDSSVSSPLTIEASKVTIGTGAEIDLCPISGDPEIRIEGLKVITSRQAAISNALTDTQKIAAILTALRTHGLIST